MNVTIKDIAERAGVSFSTVSKALRNSPLVQEQTKANILRIAREMGYRPNIAARRLVSRKSGAIGVVWPSVQRVSPSLLITEINDQLEKRAYTTLLSINRIGAAIETFYRFQVDAILVFYDREGSILAHPPVSGSIPLLYYGVSGRAPYPTIDANRGLATEMAADHLLGLGHRHIAFIGLPSYRDLLQEEKAAIFRNKMNISGCRGRIIPLEGMESHDGYLAAKTILQEKDRPTGIISGSYDLTRGILRAAGEAGIRIPEQLSVVSYDNIPAMAELYVPVTAVGVPIPVIARTTADTLVRMIEGQKETPHVLLAPELTVRSSTGRVPS